MTSHGIPQERLAAFRDRKAAEDAKAAAEVRGIRWMNRWNPVKNGEFTICL